MILGGRDFVVAYKAPANMRHSYEDNYYYPKIGESGWFYTRGRGITLGSAMQSVRESIKSNDTRGWKYMVWRVS